jgi:hypothetical protein
MPSTLDHDGNNLTIGDCFLGEFKDKKCIVMVIFYGGEVKF